MKKNLLVAMLLLSAIMVGCGKTADAESETVLSETVGATGIEEHVHAYVEEVTVGATCETDGEKTFTCECGDSYTEMISATGHIYENYVYNEDATYLADGTETATCNGCDLTDTRTAEGTKLEYTYTDMSATKYANSSVNVRNLPSTDGEKVGALSSNQEVTITGQCNETSWYRIELNGEVAYVSNNYLVNEKTVASTEPTTITENSNVGSVANTTTTDSNNATLNAGDTNVGTTTPSEDEADTNVSENETSSETVKNPNNYPEVTFADVAYGNLAPGTYYVTDTNQIVTVMPTIDGGQNESSSGTITNGDAQ